MPFTYELLCDSCRHHHCHYYYRHKCKDYNDTVTKIVSGALHNIQGDHLPGKPGIPGNVEFDSLMEMSGN